MFCSHCGKEFPDDAAFCIGCGKPNESTSIKDDGNRDQIPVDTHIQQQFTPAQNQSTQQKIPVPSVDYTLNAILTLVGYVLGFYAIGLIANILFLVSGNRITKESGNEPLGFWAFKWMFGCFFILPVIACIVVGIVICVVGAFSK